MQKKHDFMQQGTASLTPRRNRCRRALLWVGVLSAVLALPLQAQTKVKIAAASNLKFVLADLTEQYKQQTGVVVEVNLGASGNLARQILQGLPVEQFISADEERVAELVKAGRTLDAGERYATGRLAVVVPKNSALPLRQGLAAVVRGLQPSDKFALANPALAPYGLAAEQALKSAGVTELQSRQKVLGDNIGQTTQFVATGAAQAGITALALAKAPEMADLLQWAPLPESMHAPLHQSMVLLKGASPAAVAWQRFLRSPKAQAVFVQQGYALPQ